ncbi:unnamed protein product [Brachionus calyciflorus]|uniref:Ubiquitin carboxyl-terminal hydrolase n=1 Tax=Brachionus calyciflorus TaxID=104777 RepID=A0A813VBG3_9BILA|nr:unnamed protein product [Brachionus calyciflorus]
MKSTEDQRQFALKYLDKELKEGDKWYLINQDWFNKWLAYIGLRKDVQWIQTQSSNQQPEKINNQGLLEFDQDTNSYVLKENLMENVDYYTVPDELWTFITQMYQLESENDIVERQVINDSIDNGQDLKIETRLLKIHLTYKNTTKTIYISRSENWDKLKNLFDLPLDKTLKFFFKNDAKLDSIDIIKTPTFNSASVATEDTIVIDESIPAPPSLNTRSTTRSFESYSFSNRHNDYKPGLCGLSNLGNTCFMNSAIQCMSNVAPLTDYFRNGDYKEEINLVNPLGCKGELAEAYADLINEMWSGKNSYTIPRNFKYNLSRFAPQFTGYQQQDSQELLAFLLDGLHEDLNRIKKKPYVELGSHVGKSDEEFAEESWLDHKKRNDSIIVDIFHGLLKSTLNCLECGEISIKFDPFCYLSVPLPSKKERMVEIVFVPLDQNKPLTKYKCTVVKNGNMMDLCGSLEALLEKDGQKVPKNHMVVCDVYSNKFFKIYDSTESLVSIRERDDIFIYELPTNYNNGDYYKIKLHLREKSTYMHSSVCFGLPLILMLSKNTPWTYGSIYKQVVMYMKRFLNQDLEASLTQQSTSDEINSKLNNSLNVHDSEPDTPITKDEQNEHDDDEDIVTDSSQTNLRSSDRLKKKALKKKKFNLFVSKSDNFDYESVSNDKLDDEEFNLTTYNQGVSFNQPISLVADFSSASTNRPTYNKQALEDVENHPSCLLTLSNKKKDVVSLSDCFNLYTKMEDLSEQDYWYCSKCKQHQKSTKKFDLWSLPKVLVVHLKRFSYTRYSRDKIDALVDFPIKDLDMSSYLINKSTGETKYSLIAVSNHYGSLGGGHYTAYGRNRNDGRWYYFDDSSVSSSDSTSVCTPAAYLLVYLRNDLYHEYLHSDKSKQAETVNGEDSMNGQEKMDY